MLFSIGIPTLNRADLLVPALNKYVKDFEGVNIHIIDNGNQNIDFVHNSVHISVEERNIGVAASWNKLCKEIFKTKEWALIVNDDVYLGYGKTRVHMCMEMSEVGLVQSLYNWSVILINKDLYEEVGEFDEGFYPAYFEDSDYMYRMRLMGLQHEVNDFLNPSDVKISQTYEKDPELVNLSMQNNRKRYIDKWGNIPMLETFKSPFNNKI